MRLSPAQTAGELRMTEQDNAAERGQNDAGKDGEDRDILGKRQEDLTSEDLKGDARDSKGE